MGNECCGLDKAKPQDVSANRPEKYNLDDQHLEKFYAIGKVLGQGSFGKVYQATSRKDHSIRVAIKTISKKDLSSYEIEDIRNEINVLQAVDHPCIVKYYETYENSKFFYLVMELLGGNDLQKNFKDLKKQGRRYTEARLATMFYDLMDVVMHYQSLNIIHRDIKLENIVLGEDGRIKLVDFGLAKQSKGAEDELAGTGYYLAPEVIQYNYGQECDLWSIGVALYVMVQGCYPFEGRDCNTVYTKISRGVYLIPRNCSNECVDFIKKLLNIDASKRMTAKEGIQHPWILNNVSEDKKREIQRSGTMTDGTRQKLQQFRQVSQLKQALMNSYIQFLQEQQIEKLKQVFIQIDTDHSGFIEKSELKNAAKKWNETISDKEIDQIIKQLDNNGNKRIDYKEFLAATVQIDLNVLTQERKEALFGIFNVDDSGGISRDDLKNTFNKLGRELTDKEIDAIFAVHDTNSDGQIDMEEFQRILTEQ